MGSNCEHSRHFPEELHVKTQMSTSPHRLPALYLENPYYSLGSVMRMSPHGVMSPTCSTQAPLHLPKLVFLPM